MKYNKTKYPNIYTYETQKGKRYYIRRGYYLSGKKKEVTKSNLKSLVDARAALAEIERMIEANEFDAEKNLTVEQYWDIYSQNRINSGRWAPDTIAQKEHVFELHFSPRYGKKKLKEINRLEYEVYMTGLLEQYTRHTVRQMHGVFNALFNDAKTNKYIDDNPIDGTYIGKSKKKPANKRISLSDFKIWDATARETLDSYEYTMVRLTYLGARKSEVIGILVGGVSQGPSGRYTVTLSESRTYRRPSGGSMKTEGSERIISCDLETSTHLHDAIAQSHAIAKKYGRILGPTDFLFLTDYKCCHKRFAGKPVPTTRLKNLFDKISKKSGIHITPHMMRHFFASQGVIAGVPIEHMAAALGHSTSYMTQKYTHIKNEVSETVTDSFMQAIK